MTFGVALGLRRSVRPATAGTGTVDFRNNCQADVLIVLREI
jgi:hypothetical protein